MPDVFTKSKRSEIMSKIRSKGSKIEINMQEALEENKIEFEYQPKIFGKPDFFVSPKIVIFCDSSFWHGRNWKILKLQLKEGYWREHIENNKKRDKIVNKQLKKDGYTVLRFWDTEINQNIDSCIAKIKTIAKREMISRSQPKHLK
jgi:DNA mismatch endonuclease, patch repair protein